MNRLAVLLCCAAIVAAEETSIPDIASIEKQVLRYRRSMQRGHFIFTQKTYKEGIYNPRFDRTTTVWFDGKKVRNDDLFRYTDEPEEGVPHREIRCRNCEKDGYWVHYVDRKVPRGELVASMTKMGGNPSPEAYTIIHPQLVGTVLEDIPNLAASRAHLESVIGRPDRKNLSIRSTRWKGQECLQITYKLNDADFRVWISPHQGPSVIRIEGEDDFRGKHRAESIESDLRQVMPSGLWYPQSVVYERRVNGESVEKEVTEVQVLSLNESVAPETFTLAGVSLPVDKPVSVVDKRENGRGLKYWNGKELVTKSPPPHPPLTYRSSSSTRRWLLIVNAVFFAFLAAFLFWRRWRRAPST